MPRTTTAPAHPPGSQPAGGQGSGGRGGADGLGRVAGGGQLTMGKPRSVPCDTAPALPVKGARVRTVDGGCQGRAQVQELTEFVRSRGHPRSCPGCGVRPMAFTVPWTDVCSESPHGAGLDV